jgi:hypothetical protein
MKIKIKDFDYLIKKQWQALKKFNLQEKIYREESRNLNQLEKNKLHEIYRDTIEKLTACHISGFEPSGVIKNKILNKLQKSEYRVSKDLNDLKKICDKKYAEDEDQLLQKRHDDQVNVLERMIKDSQINLPLAREMDRNTYSQIKQELKRYEKELELKAGKGAIIDEDKILKPNDIIDELNNINPTQSSISLMKKPSQHLSLDKDIEMNTENELLHLNKESSFWATSDALGIDIDKYRFEGPLRSKDIFSVNDAESIGSYKDKVLTELKSKFEQNKNNTLSYLKATSVYKSKILNDFHVSKFYI